MAKLMKGWTDGPLGFPMRESVAQDTDALLKTLPHTPDYQYRRRAVTADDAQTDETARTETSFITTECVDRDKEIVVARGVDLRQFQKNPVVPFAHTYDSLPVGRCLWLKRESRGKGEGILAKTQYAAPPADWQGDWFPSAVFALIQQGVLKGKSIGFLPLEARPPKEDEIKGRPDWAGARLIFPKSVLLEYSIAPVPANPDALVQAVGKGLKIPQRMLDEMGIVLMGEGIQDAEPADDDAITDEWIAANTIIWPGEKPYPNEHACRHVDPGKCSEFRRDSKPRDSDGKAYFVIFGKSKSDGKWVEQAYRYPKGKWTSAEARAHCKSHDGILFEPASDGKAIAHVTESEYRAAINRIDVGALVQDALDRKRGRV